MSVKINIENHFITPIVVANFEGLEELNRELRELFFSYEKSPDKFKNKNKFNTNIGSLFDSPFDLFSNKAKPIQAIKQIIEDSLKGWIIRSSTVEPSFVNNIQFGCHSWFHITRTGGQKTLHNHPNASWSVVYYVDEGEVDLDSRSGMIQFYDPRVGANMHQDVSNMYLQKEFNHNGISYQPKAGMMLIFPSYLYHEVLPYRGEKPRINIAANYWVK